MDASTILYFYEYIKWLKSRTKCKKKKENEIRIKKNIIFLYKQTYIYLAIQRDGILWNDNDPMKLLSRYLQS